MTLLKKGNVWANRWGWVCGGSRYLLGPIGSLAGEGKTEWARDLVLGGVFPGPGQVKAGWAAGFLSFTQVRTGIFGPKVEALQTEA